MGLFVQELPRRADHAFLTETSIVRGRQKSTGLLPQRTHCYVGRRADLTSSTGELRARPAMCGALGRASVNFRRREPTEPKPMSTLSIAKFLNPNSTAPKKRTAKSNTPPRRKVPSAVATATKPPRSVESKAERVATAKTPMKAEEPRVERFTKQERVLTLLSQPEGASIEEMMQATDWLQHSVRGFLAGTVKKKLGFLLTSLKPNGGVRRYRIETRRTR
jgi:hypothetical protein